MYTAYLPLIHTYIFIPNYLPSYFQMFPLMMVTGQEYGGYDMDGSEIGTVLMAVAVLQIVCMVRATFLVSCPCHLHAVCTKLVCTVFLNECIVFEWLLHSIKTKWFHESIVLISQKYWINKLNRFGIIKQELQFNSMVYSFLI